MRTTLACLAAAAATHAVGHPLPWRLLNLVLSGGVFSLTYLVAAVATGALTVADRRLLWRAVGRVLPRRATS